MTVSLDIFTETRKVFKIFRRPYGEQSYNHRQYWSANISPIIFIIYYSTSNYFKDKEIFFYIELPHIDLASLGPSINDVMPKGGGGVRMTNNVEGCIKKHDEGGGGEMPQNSMTSFMDCPLSEYWDTIQGRIQDFGNGGGVRVTVEN